MEVPDAPALVLAVSGAPMQGRVSLSDATRYFGLQSRLHGSLVLHIGATSRPFSSKHPCCQVRELILPCLRIQSRGREIDRASPLYPPEHADCSSPAEPTSGLAH